MRLDGSTPSNSPRRLCEPNKYYGALLSAFMPSSPAFIRQREQRPVTPTALRAPELIHRIEWDVGIDIWTLGRLVCEAPIF